MEINNSLIKRVFNLDKFAILVRNGEVLAADNVQKYETAESFIWLINPNERKFDVSKFEKIDNLLNHSFDIIGIWSCIIKDKKSQKIKAISSIHNEFPWYYSKNNSNCISNNIFLLSSETGLKSIDLTSVASFLVLEFSVSGFTFIENINKSYGGSIIYMEKNKLSIKEGNLSLWLGFDKSIKDVQLLLTRFINAVSESIDCENAQVTLTAGSDTRAVLAGALKTKKTFKIMTGVASSVADIDKIIPNKIAQILGLEHIKDDSSKKIGPSLETMLEEVALLTNCEFMPTNWIIFYKQYMLDPKALEGVTRLRGVSGEVYKPRKDMVKDYTSKLSIIDTKLKDIVMNRAMIRYNEIQNIAGVNVKELYHLREKSQFLVAPTTRAYSRYCHVYTPFLDQKLLSLAFRYFESIEKLNFHKMIYATLPNNIVNIPINYPKLIEKLLKFKKKFVKEKVNYDYYLTPDFLRNQIDFDLLNDIFSMQKISSMIDSYENRGINSSMLHRIYAVSKFSKLIN